MKFIPAILTVLALSLSAQAEEKTHLFVLSGQSNMFHLPAEESFTPAVEKAFGKERVIIAKNAKRGSPLLAWDKDYKWPEDRPIPQGRNKPGKEKKTELELGQLYDNLIATVIKNTEGKSYDTVTFVWMQGETDAGKDLVDLYEESFQRVVNRLKADLKVDSINVVLGRLSDYAPKESWTKMRELQVRKAEENPNWAWVNTDDLNDKVLADGSIENSLHYTEEGYKILGQRFAEKAIELLKK